MELDQKEVEVTETTFTINMRYDAFIELKKHLKGKKLKHEQLREIRAFQLTGDDAPRVNDNPDD